MATELPQQLQDQLVQLQNLQQQLAVVMQQRQQIEFQVKEAERAIEELAKVAKDTPVYRSVGGLLVRAESPEAARKQLGEEKESLEVRLRGFEKQEGRLKEKGTELQSRVQAALKNLGLEPRAAAGGKKSGA